MDELHLMQARLDDYGKFSDCIVAGIEWSDHCSTVTVVMDYIWASDGAVRSPNSAQTFVELRFELVREFRCDNAFSPMVFQDPSLLGWSHNEVSSVWLLDERREITPGINLYRARFNWEMQTWIEIVFTKLSITERA